MEEKSETVAEMTARACTAMAKLHEEACAALAEVLGEGWEKRCVRVHRDSGHAFGDVREIQVDEEPVWRMWWERDGEHSYRICGAWLVGHPIANRCLSFMAASPPSGAP